jgi:hypothetical protein
MGAAQLAGMSHGMHGSHTHKNAHTGPAATSPILVPGTPHLPCPRRSAQPSKGHRCSCSRTNHRYKKTEATEQASHRDSARCIAATTACCAACIDVRGHTLEVKRAQGLNQAVTRGRFRKAMPAAHVGVKKGGGGGNRHRLLQLTQGACGNHCTAVTWSCRCGGGTRRAWATELR